MACTIWLLSSVILLKVSWNIVQGCPNSCMCFLTTVSCTPKPNSPLLTEIPQVGIPDSTTILDLRRNNIREIRRKDLEAFPNLSKLYLSENQIIYIEPGAFASLRNLKSLYLHQNRIQSITNGMFAGLSNLQQLYIHHNDIDHVSRGGFDYLVRLEQLRMDNNRVTCDCTLLQTVSEFLKNQSFQLSVTCFNPVELRDQSLTNLVKTSWLNCSPPKIEFDRKDISAVYGDSVNIECQADGNPKPDISWRFGDRIVNANERISIKDGSLTISQLSSDDAGEYRCYAHSVMGSDLALIVLRLHHEEALPSFIYTPTDTEVIKGNAARLRCSARGQPRPKIIWTRQGREVVNNRYRVLPIGDLKITKVQEEDQGYFTCQAKNAFGSITHTAQLIVKAAPLFTKTPEDVEILESETASFECRASGFPVAAIVWHKDSRRLPVNNHYSVLQSGTLRILNAAQEHAGEYECHAINVIGVNVTTAKLAVKARVPPKILEHPPDTAVQSGNKIFFTCKAEGAPDPVITWIKDSVQVANGNRFTTNPKTGTLEIRDIGKVDEGRWECAARNSIGFASEAFQLTVVSLKNGEYKGDKFVRTSVKKAISEVNRAIELTKKNLQNLKPRSSDLLALFRFPSPEAFEIAKAAEIFELAIQLIQKQVDNGRIVINKEEMDEHPYFNILVSPEQIHLLANLSGCTAHRRPANCSDLCFHLKYRTYDGSCNNLNHPMWGASLTPFSRLLSPMYENGFNIPVGWTKTEGKPSARLLTQKIVVTHEVTDDEEYTHMLMQWGQFLDHDLDFTVTSPSTTRFVDGVPCSGTCDNQHPCFPIQIPKDDNRIRHHKCMEFTRSSAVCGSGSTSLFLNSITPRQQINQITSYIDASNVYGSSEHDAKNLRDLKKNEGRLKVGLYSYGGKPFLPFNKDTPIDCQVNKSESTVPCFLAGDHRANEQLGLLAMHTLWMREHNTIAKKLKELNPEWNGERIYQETRKIVGAEMQHITVTEWLPKILGKSEMKKFGNYNGYNPNTDASIFNSFATAAFRFGHTLIQPVLNRLNESFLPIKQGNLPLHKAFFSPQRLLQDGGIDPLLRGLFASPGKSRSTTNQLLNSELTERLFQMAHVVALDLGALNIQRGRDHALPGYNTWRQFCNMTLATRFDDFAGEIRSKSLRDKMEELYLKPDNVDLWIGAIAEDPLQGSRLGPLLSCLISLQFKRLREGDRFWYENPSIFSPEQLIQIKQMSLARVLCDNGDNINRVQRDVFKYVGSDSEYQPCENIPGKDLRFWKDCCSKDTCKDRDTTFTVSNQIRQRRSLDVQTERINNTDAKVPKDPSITVTQGNATSSHFESKTVKEDGDQQKDNKVGNIEKELDVARLQITRLQDEIKVMKLALMNNKILSRECKDRRGVVRKHGEFWNEFRDICQCLNAEIKCA